MSRSLDPAKANDPQQKMPQTNKSEYIISSRCDTSACVGVKKLGDGRIAVTNTSNLAKQPIVFTKEEWRVFILGAKDGEFDIA